LSPGDAADELNEVGDTCGSIVSPITAAVTQPRNLLNLPFKFIEKPSFIYFVVCAEPFGDSFDFSEKILFLVSAYLYRR
jgi:hypothetical protein